MDIKRIIYNNSNVLIQNILCSLKGYIIRLQRYNRNFFIELDRYENNYYVPEDALRDILNSASNCEYYKKIIIKNNINLNATNIFEELKKFPILKREYVASNYESFINKQYKGKTFKIGTSGTTGTSLVFPCSVDRNNKQWAIWWRYWRKLGIDFNTMCGHFGGQIVVPINHNKPPYWRYNYFGRQFFFSPYHLSINTIEDYYNKIKSAKLTWLHGHAHNLTLLSSLIIERDLDPIKSVMFITTGADSLFQRQRQIINHAFPKSMIRQHYGMSEAVCNISENINGELKVDEDFGYVEFVPIDNINQSLFKIIATGFNNHPFPLIRYDTGDLATIDFKQDGSITVVQIDGRTTDCLMLPNGRRISSTSITNFEYTTKVREVQFIQKDLYNIILRVVRRQGFSSKDEKEVINTLRKRLPKEVNIIVEYVDKIERTKSGKIKYIISLVSKENS